MNIYASRRRRLLDTLGSEAVAVLFAAPEQRRSNDTDYPFRQDSYLHYLSGFPEPQSALVLDGQTGECLLFCRPKDPLRETWDGFRFGPEAARETFGFDEAYDIGQLHDVLEGRLKGSGRLYALWGRYPQHDQAVLSTWQKVQQAAGQRAATAAVRAPDALMDLSRPLDKMRLIKEPAELELLRTAGSISAQAHIRAMQKCRPGMYEYQLEAEFLHEFMRKGARFPAYNSIIGGGKNACCLHYVENKDVLRDGDLVLIDAGAEYQGYAGDITRTFPVNGRFSSAQKDVYEIVLAANEEAVAAVRPGADWQDIVRQAVRTLTQGLIDLKLLQGSVDDNIEQGTYRRFYMHGLGHWIGLDVHDVGNRFENGQSVLLAEGMCTTVEPGLYIGNEPDIPEALRNTGVRIEDNVAVTATGCDNYTAQAPKSVAEIEELMRRDAEAV